MSSRNCPKSWHSTSVFRCSKSPAALWVPLWQQHLRLFSKLCSFVNWRFCEIPSTICREHLHLQHGQGCFVKKFEHNFTIFSKALFKYQLGVQGTKILLQIDKSSFNLSQYRLSLWEHDRKKAFCFTHPQFKLDIRWLSHWNHGVHTLWSVAAWQG